jgi:diacylglycerol kinase (ATP)
LVVLNAAVDIYEMASKDGNCGKDLRGANGLFRSTQGKRLKNTGAVRTCVIFNPTARGEKAKRFQSQLERAKLDFTFKPTTAAGHARTLAAQAVEEGFETIVAAGGDGTLNEVLNGIGDAPEGFSRARLGVLPLGTVNVFAKELGMPAGWRPGSEVLRAGKEIKIDLPQVEFTNGQKKEQRYFAQLAGTGLDARAIELANYELKKKLGPLAYVWAGVRAMSVRSAQVTITDGTRVERGDLVLVGNGRFYGGRYQIHPQADLSDGLLDVCVFPKINWFTVLRCAGMFFSGRPMPAGVAKCFRTKQFTLECESPTPLEVDGENIGHLPATFSISNQKLRVVMP